MQLEIIKLQSYNVILHVQEMYCFAFNSLKTSENVSFPLQ